MGCRIVQVLIVAGSMLIEAGPSLAACSSSAKIDDGNRKFSVLVPKSAGLGSDQTYDDIGCAVLSRNEECATRQGMFDSGAMVYDHLTGTALPAEKAFFVLRTDVATPQGYGVVAFKDKNEAEKFSTAHGRGKVVKWFELVDQPLK